MRRDRLRLEALSPAAQDLERSLLLSLIDIHLRRASTDALAAVERDLHTIVEATTGFRNEHAVLAGAGPALARKSGPR
jgi:hypothetical protein